MTDGSQPPKVAYFSMEVGLEPDIPTYAGGLGVLAGDTLRSAADIGLPIVAVSLVHREGYFTQELDSNGQQHERPSDWNPTERLERVDAVVEVTLERRTVKVGAYAFHVRGRTGLSIEVLLLDTDIEGNTEWDRLLTDRLYGGDARYRLCQEAILGCGGIRMLRALGHKGLEKFHMNEGHSALLALELLSESLAGRRLGELRTENVDRIRLKCVFTTHTPVPAGHDRFDRGLTERILGAERIRALETLKCLHEGQLNMTYLALRCSEYVNGVAMRHGEVSRGMFPNYPISAITNGVHAGTWIAPAFGELFDRRIGAWRRDEAYLRYAISIPVQEIREVHARCKRELLEEVHKRTGIELNPFAMTIGFARRASAYKRADLLFTDMERLRRIAREAGALQIVYAGKAHPRDEAGKRLIRAIFEAARQLRDDIPVVYMPDYGMRLAGLMTAGVDLWLNTPKIPQEASGTSGMKAAMNGVPSLSILDGWWVEGHIEGVTGWAIGDGLDTPDGERVEAKSLYGKLETTILPLFYGRPVAYGDVMRHAIALNGQFFNSRRMVSQYIHNAYFPDLTVVSGLDGWSRR